MSNASWCFVEAANHLATPLAPTRVRGAVLHCRRDRTTERTKAVAVFTMAVRATGQDTKGKGHVRAVRSMAADPRRSDMCIALCMPHVLLFWRWPKGGATGRSSSQLQLHEIQHLDARQFSAVWGLSLFLAF